MAMHQAFSVKPSAQRRCCVELQSCVCCKNLFECMLFSRSARLSIVQLNGSPKSLNHRMEDLLRNGVTPMTRRSRPRHAPIGGRRRKLAFDQLRIRHCAEEHKSGTELSRLLVFSPRAEVTRYKVASVVVNIKIVGFAQSEASNIGSSFSELANGFGRHRRRNPRCHPEHYLW